jgi:hypothetical protein
MSLVKIPEAVLLKTIEDSLNYIRADYKSQSDKSKSWLAQAFQDTSLQVDKYNFYNELVVILIVRDEADPKFFEGDLMFDRRRERVPSYHITLPSESLSDGNTLGVGESDFSLFIPETTELNSDIDIKEVFTRRIQTNYNIVIMSDNSNEVVAIYHLMRAILIASTFAFNTLGLENLTHAGQDVQPYRELATQLYMRAISIGFQYQTSVPSLTFNKMVTEIQNQGIPKS